MLVGRETLKRVDASGEVGGSDEVDQVPSQLLMIFVVIALRGRFLEDTVHSFELRPGDVI